MEAAGPPVVGADVGAGTVVDGQVVAAAKVQGPVRLREQLAVLHDLDRIGGVAGVDIEVRGIFRVVVGDRRVEAEPLEGAQLCFDLDAPALGFGCIDHEGVAADRLVYLHIAPVDQIRRRVDLGAAIEEAPLAAHLVAPHRIRLVEFRQLGGVAQTIEDVQQDLTGGGDHLVEAAGPEALGRGGVDDGARGEDVFDRELRRHRIIGDLPQHQRAVGHAGGQGEAVGPIVALGEGADEVGHAQAADYVQLIRRAPGELAKPCDLLVLVELVDRGEEARVDRAELLERVRAVQLLQALVVPGGQLVHGLADVGEIDPHDIADGALVRR